MINNLEKLKYRLLEVFDINNPDLFFHVEIIQRKKEVSNINKNSNVVKSYVVKSLDYLEYKLENEIIPICNTLNARAMINLNPKSFKRVTHAMLRKLSEYIEDNFYEGVITKLFTSCTDATSIDKSIGIEKYWILDIDTKDPEVLSRVQSTINLCEPIEEGKNKVKCLLESKNGFHIFATHFNVQTYEKLKANNSQYFKDVEVKKDCLTNLYIP
jgi:hypothetical protein